MPKITLKFTNDYLWQHKHTFNPRRINQRGIDEGALILHCREVDGASAHGKVRGLHVQRGLDGGRVHVRFQVAVLRTRIEAGSQSARLNLHDVIQQAPLLDGAARRPQLVTVVAHTVNV